MIPGTAYRRTRRRLVAAMTAWGGLAALPRTVTAADAPHFRELDLYLAGRAPVLARLALDVPRIADNGNAVSMRVSMDGPFTEGAHVTAIRLFSEKNPVPLMALFEFPVPLSRIDVESRIRLAGSQRIVAVAETADGKLYEAVAEVSVTISACLDGT
jgi:sulfur-oxidizing protein SoxY